MLLLTKYIWCFHRHIKSQCFILVESIAIDSEQREWRWYTVGDEAKHRIRVKGIIFIKGWSWDIDVVELLRPEVNNVRGRVLVQLGSFDEDVGSSGE